MIINKMIGLEAATNNIRMQHISKVSFVNTASIVKYKKLRFKLQLLLHLSSGNIGENRGQNS